MALLPCIALCSSGGQHVGCVACFCGVLGVARAVGKSVSQYQKSVFKYHAFYATDESVSAGWCVDLRWAWCGPCWSPGSALALILLEWCVVY